MSKPLQLHHSVIWTWKVNQTNLWMKISVTKMVHPVMIPTSNWCQSEDSGPVETLKLNFLGYVVSLQHHLYQLMRYWAICIGQIQPNYCQVPSALSCLTDEHLPHATPLCSRHTKYASFFTDLWMHLLPSTKLDSLLAITLKKILLSTLNWPKLVNMFIRVLLFGYKYPFSASPS